MCTLSPELQLSSERADLEVKRDGHGPSSFEVERDWQRSALLKKTSTNTQGHGAWTWEMEIGCVSACVCVCVCASVCLGSRERTLTNVFLTLC